MRGIREIYHNLSILIAIAHPSTSDVLIKTNFDQKPLIIMLQPVLKAAFNQIDTNHNGVIEPEEWEYLWKLQGVVDPSKAKVNIMSYKHYSRHRTVQSSSKIRTIIQTNKHTYGGILLTTGYKSFEKRPFVLLFSLLFSNITDFARRGDADAPTFKLTPLSTQHAM